MFGSQAKLPDTRQMQADKMQIILWPENYGVGIFDNKENLLTGVITGDLIWVCVTCYIINVTSVTLSHH